MGLSKRMIQKNQSREDCLQTALILHWPGSLRLSDNQFYEFCRANEAWRIERTTQGDCVIMALTGGETSWRNSRLITLLSLWADGEGSGVVFDSSGGFILPDGAVLSPDVSWVRRSRLAALTAEQKAQFIPLCPDFVIELRSPSDRLSDLQDKMRQYLNNGARLGWLIDSEIRQVYVYTPGHPAECRDNPERLSGEPVLQGFVLDLKGVWEVGF